MLCLLIAIYMPFVVQCYMSNKSKITLALLSITDFMQKGILTTYQANKFDIFFLCYKIARQKSH